MIIFHHFCGPIFCKQTAAAAARVEPVGGGGGGGCDVAERPPANAPSPPPPPKRSAARVITTIMITKPAARKSTHKLGYVGSSSSERAPLGPPLPGPTDRPSSFPPRRGPARLNVFLWAPPARPGPARFGPVRSDPIRRVALWGRQTSRAHNMLSIAEMDPPPSSAPPRTARWSR